MLRRIAVWALGLFMTISFSCSVQAFSNRGQFLDAVSSVPDTVYGMYLGQPYEAYRLELSKGHWECVANGFEGKTIHPAAIYYCERGPKMRETVRLVQDGYHGTLRKIEFAFTSDFDGDTKYIADALYYNLSRLNMLLVEDQYASQTPYAEWKIGDEHDNRRLRLEYRKQENGDRIAEAVVTRYIKDNP